MSIIFYILILGINLSNGIKTNHDIIMDYIDDNYDIENLESFYDYVNTQKDMSYNYINNLHKFLKRLLKRYVYLDISLNSKGSDYPMTID